MEKIMNKLKVVLTALLILGVFGCSTIKVINPGGCGSAPNESTCLGETTIPIEHEELFLKASKQAIDIVSSDEFKQALIMFSETNTLSGAHVSAWSGVDVKSIPDLLMADLHGLEISTFGGLSGLAKKLLFGTQAKEGTEDGPILFNRWSLKRSSASIANTIVHEAAHRIGLSHPSRANNEDVGLCEPPYVIGSLIEKQIEGSNWKPKGHCSLLKI
jgi:hypothetical protein